MSDLELYNNTLVHKAKPPFGFVTKGCRMGFAYDPAVRKMAVFANNKHVGTLVDITGIVYPMALLGGRDVQIELAASKWHYPFPK